jgi:hypothetical protein
MSEGALHHHRLEQLVSSTSVHLESRIVVGRRRPMETRRTRLEVPTTAEAVALGHLATHVDDLAIPGKLREDSANSQSLELCNWSFSSVRRCRWSSCLRDMLFLVHAWALLWKGVIWLLYRVARQRRLSASRSPGVGRRSLSIGGHIRAGAADHRLRNAVRPMTSAEVASASRWLRSRRAKG